MSAEPFQPWHGEAVLRAFAELTGIRFRIVSEDIRRQAMVFAQHFSLAELETVILWTRRRIASQQGGYSASSLQWGVLMGRPYAGQDLAAFQVFQERLGLAEEEMKRTGWRPRFTLGQPVCTAPAKAAQASPVQPTDEQRQAMAEKARREAALLRQKLQGGGE